jgi:hypothetical protein
MSENLGVENLPSRRADLYAARLGTDTAIKAWVDTADPRVAALYGLAYRMLAERRALDLPTFNQWLGAELAARDPTKANATDEAAALADILQGSRQFRQVKVRNRLGQQEDVVTFDHELVGKFLAARHARVLLQGGDPEKRKEVLELAANETWQDVFFFVIDEAAGPKLPSLLLDNLLYQSGTVRLALVAYAIKTKADEDPPLPPSVREKYNDARLREDIRLTPAA